MLVPTLTLPNKNLAIIIGGDGQPLICQGQRGGDVVNVVNVSQRQSVRWLRR